MSVKNQKVILNQTISRVGIAGDTIEVKPGFARNYLLPKKLAAPWSAKAEEMIQQRKAALAKKRAVSQEAALDIKSRLEEKVITISAKTATKPSDNTASKLFGAIKGDQIAQAIKETFDIEVSKTDIEPLGVIKTTGPAKAVAHLFEGVSANLKLNIVAGAK